MLKIGELNNLKVIKKVEFGMYLDDTDGGEVLLPRKYVPEGLNVGDIAKVFVYTDSEDRRVATTLIPKAKVGDFVTLRVKDLTRVGAFLDWGLEKDLLLPFGEYDKELKVGDGILVMVLLDRLTNRVMATTKFNKYLEKENIELNIGQEVELIIYKETMLGASAIINQKYSGLIFASDMYRQLEVGEIVTGYVKKIRKEDGKVDLTLRKPGFDEVIDAREKILKAIEDNKGALPLTDDSSPEKIREMLGMSKKTFKKAVGTLYKERIIELTTKGIKLQKK